ncbi:F-box/WD repeat-containing protein 4 [Prorops nasuta]|uniref:F-box/WD repeat-containing protein 4 n=1 Tax=Prorops nasuta TaxID=863751 RepID=UPI0034CDEDF1
MTDILRLDNLPSDVLILIFDYCTAFDLFRLSCVCTRFYEIIRHDTLWIKKCKQSLVTNQTSSRFCERCNPLLNLRAKWHVSNNWQYGRYEKIAYFSHKIKLMPWIQLTKNTLWWGGGSQLYGFKRWPQNKRHAGHLCEFRETDMKSDICKFIVLDDMIVTGHRDGNIRVWLKHMIGSSHFLNSISRAHYRDVNALIHVSNIIISAGADGKVKFWNIFDESVVNNPIHTISEISERIWSLSLCPSNNKFAVGSSGHLDLAPINIYDLQCYSKYINLQHEWRRGAGVLDMVWDTPQTLLTCGYDTSIRKWDMRTGTCVSDWPDPTDATLYCISSDYQYTMITGTQFNCKAVLWDQRQREYVQLYFLNLQRMSSPVYSLQFDSSHLYAATDQNLIELNFSGYSNKENNYREMLKAV